MSHCRPSPLILPSSLSLSLSLSHFLFSFHSYFTAAAAAALLAKSDSTYSNKHPSLKNALIVNRSGPSYSVLSRCSFVIYAFAEMPTSIGAGNLRVSYPYKETVVMKRHLLSRSMRPFHFGSFSVNTSWLCSLSFHFNVSLSSTLTQPGCYNHVSGLRGMMGNIDAAGLKKSVVC